jgi:hypothetical protein
MPQYRSVHPTVPLIVSTLIIFGAVTTLAIQNSRARQAPSRRSSGERPITNPDIIRMSKNGFGDDAIMTTIQSNKTQFDLSVDALIALKNAGISERVISAMQATHAAARIPQSPRPAVPQENTAAPPIVATTPQRLEQPYVLVVFGGTRQPLPLEPTRVGKAEANGENLGELAKQQATDKLYNAVELATATRIGIALDSRLAAIPFLGAATGIGATMMDGIGKAGRIFHKPKPVTYLWAVPGRGSSLQLRTSIPQFEVVYGEIPGIDPDEYEPIIVRLFQTRENWRLVGAKKDDPEAYRKKEWSIYSEFIEERISIHSNRRGRGHFMISMERALEGGEYGVVLRPTSRSKVFSGDDIANRKNSGVLFDTVWSFSVTP